MASVGLVLPRTSAIDTGTSLGSIPRSQVLDACGSRSTISTLWPAVAAAEASPSVTVVLPTPPFWLSNATM